MYLAWAPSTPEYSEWGALICGGAIIMDATRTRRVRDQARKKWYAWYRQWRFARYLGFEFGASTPGNGLLIRRGASCSIRTLPA
jgi:hypothetical protein